MNDVPIRHLYFCSSEWADGRDKLLTPPCVAVENTDCLACLRMEEARLRRELKVVEARKKQAPIDFKRRQILYDSINAET